MRHRTVRVIPALAAALAVGIAVAGCTAATASTGAASTGSASVSAAASATKTSAPADGPYGPDPACVAALKAESTLQTSQLKDENDESALTQDFTNFANALNAAAQQEKHPATATAMSTLASDYTALVESQSGGAQLPDVSTVQNDGTAFDKACSSS
jgi:hypothetical protein